MCKDSDIFRNRGINRKVFDENTGCLCKEHGSPPIRDFHSMLCACMDALDNLAEVFGQTTIGFASDPIGDVLVEGFGNASRDARARGDRAEGR